LIRQYGNSPCHITGTSKIYNNEHMSISPILDVDFKDLNYKAAKLKQLIRNYYNEESTELAIESLYKKVKKGNKGSVGISCHGQHKKGTEQGFCLQSYVLTNNGPTTSLTIFYRTTELVKKFYADMCFFNHFILPKFKESLELNPL